MIYVILGMHKSGTTLLARTLHHSGINMGDYDPTVSYDQKNFYERRSTYLLNLDILGRLNNDIMIGMPTPPQVSLSMAQRWRMGEIIAQCNQQYPDWGFKEPRTCLVYGLWAEELPTHKIIATYRHPSEIWPRYMYHTRRHAPLNIRMAWHYINRWLEYNSRIVRYLQETTQPYILFNYRHFMADSRLFEQLQEFVGRPLNDQRQQKLYRNQPRTYPLLALMTRLAYYKTGLHPETVMSQLTALER